MSVHFPLCLHAYVLACISFGTTLPSYESIAEISCNRVLSSKVILVPKILKSVHFFFKISVFYKLFLEGSIAVTFQKSVCKMCFSEVLLFASSHGQKLSRKHKISLSLYFAAILT